MVWLLRQRRNAEQDFLRARVERLTIDGESRHPVFKNTRHRVKNIEPMIRQEPRVEHQPKQSVLGTAENRQSSYRLGLLPVWPPDFHGAMALTEIDPAISGD